MAKVLIESFLQGSELSVEIVRKGEPLDDGTSAGGQVTFETCCDSVTTTDVTAVRELRDELTAWIDTMEGA